MINYNKITGNSINGKEVINVKNLVSLISKVRLDNTLIYIINYGFQLNNLSNLT